MNEADVFLKALHTDPKAKELLKESGEPANAEEAAEKYAAIAEKLGFDVTKEHLMRFLDAKEKVYQAQAAKAATAVKEALDEDALDSVAGGAGDNPECSSTFSPHEWCWVSDSCSWAISTYDVAPVQPDENLACTENVLTIKAENQCMLTSDNYWTDFDDDTGCVGSAFLGQK